MSTPEPIVVSYHTPDPYYTMHAARLRESLRVRRVQHVIACLEPIGQTWSLRCQAKASFIRSMCCAFPNRPVVWIDADAELVKSKDEFMAALPSLGVADVAAYRNSSTHGGRNFPLVNSTLMSGTLVFLYCLRGGVLDAWVELTRSASPDEYDQELLARAINTHTGAFPKCAPLDPRLVCVPDLMPGVDPIVLHHQASRDPRSGKGG